ncbi:MAG: DUF2807 domain-containing protein [Prevotella sp.]|nr:DUF2807 domain-containing protein [Prevotella sp.]
MKTRFLFAALLLLAFGSMKAQDTITVVKRGADPIKADTVLVVTPNMSELPGLMQELGVYLQHLTDSVHWNTFEEDMEKWGQEMEEWGRKMERWGEQFEGSFEASNSLKSSGNPDDPVRSIQVEGSGDVIVRQTQDQFSLVRNDELTSQYEVVNGTLLLSGSSDYEVSMQQLDEVLMRSSGDVLGRGTLKGNNLHIAVYGSGDLRMDVAYDTIRVELFGSGDVTLMGQCQVICADLKGSGDLRIPQLHYNESNMNATGSGKVVVNGSSNVILHHSYRREPRLCERTLLLDANWNGFEAGLNMLVSPTLTDVYVSMGGTNGMELRPLRSWYFGFNIADVGIAFDRRHTVGLFTGVGLGWNNYSWNNDVTIEYDPDNVINTLVPIDPNLVVKTSKYGALFLQAPLMVEVRPTRGMYIDLGVTAGLRIAQWNRVKYADGNSEKRYFSGPLNQFKLDASLRVGGSDLGFFANYALLPIFSFGNEQEAHPISFGFSINF